MRRVYLSYSHTFLSTATVVGADFLGPTKAGVVGCGCKLPRLSERFCYLLGWRPWDLMVGSYFAFNYFLCLRIIF